MMKPFAIIIVVVALSTFQSDAEISVTNNPFAGVKIFSETRTNPPNRLFIAEIDLANPRVTLHVSRGGDDPDGPGRWQTTLMQPSRIALREGFDLVVNGDFFDARGVEDAEGTDSRYRAEIWSSVSGPAASDGKVWAVATNARPALVIDKDGSVNIETIASPGTNAFAVISGNTMLVRNGNVILQNNKVRHPRTAAGLDKERRRLVLLVVDGRKPGVARGMSYDELAAEMLRLGCHDAFNLDGGGSSVMAIRDRAANRMKILNEPTDGRERPVANVLGVSVKADSADAKN
jgi:exopolysaccharide biosynthesis protein